MLKTSSYISNKYYNIVLKYRSIELNPGTKCTKNIHKEKIVLLFKRTRNNRTRTKPHTKKPSQGKNLTGIKAHMEKSKKNLVHNFF